MLYNTECRSDSLDAIPQPCTHTFQTQIEEAEEGAQLVGSNQRR